MLSRRVQLACDGSSFLVDAFLQQLSNKYDPTSNPHGIINFGTAENKIVFDLIKEKLSTVPLKSFPEKYAHYCDSTGAPEFRDKLSNFINHYMKPSLTTKAENIFVFNGCGPAVEALGFSLCDEGEMIMTPAPFYGAFSSDLFQRFGTLLYPIHISSEGHVPYNLSVEKLRSVLHQAKRDGLKIKALLLSNPYNPIGTIYSLSEMESYARFCYENNIHLISDEIYFFSTRDEDGDGNSMKSILSLESFHKYRDIVHVVWGFSKDFGISGFRCGLIVTFKPALQRCLSQVCLYYSLPTIAQYIMMHVISEYDWVDRFVKTNRNRLNKSLDIVVETLNEMDIPYIWPSGGIFVWFNVKKYLKSDSIESERDLFRDLMKNGIYIAPGLAFDSREHGWFRIVISINELELRLGLKRFRQTLISTKAKKRHIEN